MLGDQITRASRFSIYQVDNGYRAVLVCTRSPARRTWIVIASLLDARGNVVALEEFRYVVATAEDDPGDPSFWDAEGAIAAAREEFYPAVKKITDSP